MVIQIVGESPESRSAFRESGLAASIPDTCRVKGRSEAEIIESLFELRARS